MRLALEPMDVALFRDPRPFTATEYARAETVGIVPPQTTIYGTLRHLLLEHGKISYGDFHEGRAPEEISKVIGTKEKFGSLAISGPWLEWEEGGRTEALLAWPADAVRVRGRGFDTGGFLAPGGESEEEESNRPRELVPLRPYRMEETGWVACGPETEIIVGEGSVMPAGELGSYLTGAGHEGRPTGAFIGREVRVGIARDDESYRPREGMLFAVSYLRGREGVGGRDGRAAFGIEVDDDGSLKHVGETPVIVGMGGERRPFRIKARALEPVVGEGVREAVRQCLVKSWRGGQIDFRLLLVTRGVFRGGWRPGFFEGGEGQGGVKYELRSAAVGRAVALGSWDLSKRGKPGAREVKRYAPEGSVYFVRAQGEEGMPAEAMADEILDKFWWKKALCEDTDRARLGQGLTLVGGMKNV